MNPYGLLHTPLKRARLPISPPRRNVTGYHPGRLVSRTPGTEDRFLKVTIIEMITLYTWAPTAPVTILQPGVSPDIGHSSMWVRNAETGDAGVYMSFWPEKESLIGVITQLWKPRETRNPVSYAQEIDPNSGFMRRPADHTSELEGLDEVRVLHLWERFGESRYDFLKWNCSSVCRLLLLSATPPKLREAMRSAMACSVEEVAQMWETGEREDIAERLRYLSTSAFIDCRPDDLKRAAAAYLGTMTGTTAEAPAAIAGVSAM